jgi:hypothetical protein
VTAGYSGTPLPRKLGIAPATVVTVFGRPPDYASLLGELPAGTRIVEALSRGTTLVHLFTTQRADLEARLAMLRSRLADDVPIWVSWPKKSSRVATDITEDTIRELALPLGFVDVKVCAVSEVWSGLKLVVRKELRRKSAAR